MKKEAEQANKGMTSKNMDANSDDSGEEEKINKKRNRKGNKELEGEF